MRNHQAEEVLNADMLYLVQCYADSLQESTYLNSTIELLLHTSILAQNFGDPRPITYTADGRLEQHKIVPRWFIDLESLTGIKTNVLFLVELAQTLHLLSLDFKN